MKSPFPGMDPYVERFWNDVHNKLCGHIADELNERGLPSHYRATMNDRVLIADLDEPLSGEEYPDVAVLDWPATSGTHPAPTIHSQRLLVRSPIILSYVGDPIPQYTVEIVDTRYGEKVVTSIEVLSPSNKRSGDGLTQFRQKQAYNRAARVNRVDIDLLRRGTRPFEFPERLLRPEQRKPYYVTVHRGHAASEVEIYAIDLRDPLPVIGVPLRAGEADAAVDLQPLIDRVYSGGRFPMDYDRPCDPPLTGDDADWAAGLLAARPR